MPVEQLIVELVARDRRFSAEMRNAGREVSTLNRGLNAIKPLLGTLGFAAASAGIVAYGKAAAEAARQQEDARNRLVQAVGSVAAYNEAITQARDATQGMVSETELASGAFVLLETGLAKNITEATKLANAGNILAQAFESQGASVELFNRVLATGSTALIDNFGISRQQVAVRAEQIQATQDLGDQEAKLQAIRELSIEKAERLQSTMSETTIASQQLQAATADLSAAIGQSLVPAAEKSTTVLARFARSLADSINTQNQAISALNRYGLSQRAIFTASGELVNASEILNQARLIEQNELNKLQVATYQTVTAVEDLTEAELRLAQAGEEAAAKQRELARGAETARLAGMAAAFGLGGPLGDEGQADFTRVTPGEFMDQFFGEVEESSKSAARSIASSFESAFNDLRSTVESIAKPSLDEVWSAPVDDARFDEDARRLATVATSGFSSEWLGQLSDQFAGQDFFQPVLEAMQGGDQAALQAAATEILQNNVTALWDPEIIKAQVRQQIQEANLREEFFNTITEELAGEGVGGEGLGALGSLFEETLPTSVEATNEAFTGLADNTLEQTEIVTEAFGKEQEMLNMITVETLPAMTAAMQSVGQKGAAAGSGTANEFGNAKKAIQEIHPELEELGRELDAVKRKAEDAASALQSMRGARRGGSISITGRQRGGPVAAGQPFVVGELGPELFVPATGGRIVPNSQIGSSGLTIGTINLHGVNDPQAMFSAIEREARARGMRFSGMN